MEKKLGYERKSCWLKYSEKETKEVHSYAEDYKDFLSRSKTERLSVENIKKLAIKNKFSESSKKTFFIENRGKNLAIVKMGAVSPLKGINIIGSHVDVPRIDLKQVPLYEKENIAHFKTHYYGGIKKYHWLSRPLAIYGVVFLKNGKKLDIAIGDDDNDPVFAINDLLPHLSRSQNSKTVNEAFEGEKLNIIVGSIPLKKTEKDAVKANALEIINRKYSIVEEDFISAELEVVPQGKARDIGFDRGLVGGYGHDDRICGYTSATAIFEAKNKKTACAILFDKEEVGSQGATGAQSKFIEDIIIEILKRAGEKPTYENIRTVMKNSDLLSSDVSCGIDPDFQEVHEQNNGAKIGYGLVITKYTGSGGKYGANDSGAEFVFKVKSIFDKAGVTWQTAELGKVDAGGGGTIAAYLANHGISVIDCGTALLGMHSPFEIASKADLFETHRGYKAFFEA
ncbi:MAG: aminopeptidase [bacterium]|nr:aminopeptidase [bacterium]